MLRLGEHSRLGAPEPRASRRGLQTIGQGFAPRLTKLNASGRPECMSNGDIDSETRLLGAIPETEASTEQSESRSGILETGDLVRDMEIIGLIGRGGFGATYLAKANDRERLAVKEYYPISVARRTEEGYLEPSSEDAAIDYFDGLGDFAREAQRLRLLSHPNIPKVTRFVATRGTAYFAMPYLPGQTLADELRKRKTLPKERFGEIFAQLLDALDYIHDAGMLHRDVKPGNIYVSDRQTAYLLDFGSARRAMERRSEFIGEPVTHGFSPVEQYDRNARHDAATDIYAMAATMYVSMTGNRPPQATDRTGNDPYWPLSARRHLDYPADVKHAVDQALAVHAEDRPQSVHDWRTMLGL